MLPLSASAMRSSIPAMSLLELVMRSRINSVYKHDAFSNFKRNRGELQEMLADKAMLLTYWLTRINQKNNTKLNRENTLNLQFQNE